MKITKKQWENHVGKNSNSSYGLVTCLAILMLWEAGVKNKEEAEKFLMKQKFGLTGFQAGCAVNFALEYKPTNFLDKTMCRILRG